MRNEIDFLSDVLVRLNREQLDYMLTGSMASNYWGMPRTTHDLDFVLVLRPGDVEKVLRAFGTGFFVQRQSVESALRPPYQFNVLDEQSALKADFWIRHDNEFENAAFERRLNVEIFSVAAWIATAEDIILHKLRWHAITPSDQQLYDAAGVYAVQGDLLDWDYLEAWAPKLGVEMELAEIRAGRIRPKST